MYLDEADKQKLAGVLSEAKKKYSPGAGATRRSLRYRYRLKTTCHPEDPLQVATDFFFPGLTAKPWHNPADFSIVAKLEQAWEEKLMLRTPSR